MFLYVTTPLQPPYDGPYRVLKRTDKHYTLDVAGRPQVVSLDRLEPAYLESDLVTDVDTPTQISSVETYVFVSGGRILDGRYPSLAPQISCKIRHSFLSFYLEGSALE